MVSEAFLESVWKMHGEGKKIVQIALETGKERHAISRYIKTYENKMKINSKVNDQAGQKGKGTQTNAEFIQEDKLREKALSILSHTGLDIDTLALLERYYEEYHEAIESLGINWSRIVEEALNRGFEQLLIETIT